MRFLVLAVAFLLSLPAVADVAAPQPNSQVKITTPMLTYEGVFLREEISAETVYWIVQTDSGTTSVPKSTVTKVELVGSAAPKLPAVERKVEPALAKPGSLDLRIHGSNTIGAKLAPEIARAYAEKYGLASATTTMGSSSEDFDVEYTTSESDRKYIFRFQAHGSTTAFQDLLGGVADIGMSSRRIKDEEVKLLKDQGLGDLRAPRAENVIALDGVAVIVNKGNPVEALSLDQLFRIFSGEL